MPPLTPQTLERLRAFDTPTICNIIELFDIQPYTSGYTDARLQAVFPHLPPMVGYAATATFRAAAAPREGDVYASLPRQVARFPEIEGPPVVVFQDLDSPSAAATFGEVMCTTYRAFGAAGLITSGTGRDLDQVARLDFPVFTGGTIASHGYGRIVELHVPVQVAGLTIYPGDLLHGDRNGVAIIPPAIADQIPDIGAEFVAAEGIIIGAMREPDATLDRLNAAVAEFEAVTARLRRRAAGR